jgi:hypothetical protein
MGKLTTRSFFPRQSSPAGRVDSAVYEGEAMAAPSLDDLLAGVPKDARQQAVHGPDIRYGLGWTSG